MNTEDRNYELIVAYFEKTISDEGLNELGEWLDEHPDHQEQFRETLHILEASRLYFGPARSAASSWKKISEHIRQDLERPQTKVRKLRWLPYAAAMLLISGSLTWFYTRPPAPAAAISYTEFKNPEGRQSRIMLPDSSVVYLAGGSKIRYAENLSGKTRAVYLNGEAFFDVHHKQKPFVIKSGDISTVVLGTSFNVKAFEADHKVSVTVNTGKVGVMNRVNGKNVLLKYLLPDEQISINTITGNYRFEKVNSGHTKAWIHNHFIFYNKPLREVMASLEHRYGKKISIIDPEAGNIRVTAKFNNLPFNLVMDELMMLSGLDFKERKGELFIYQPNHEGGKEMK